MPRLNGYQSPAPGADFGCAVFDRPFLVLVVDDDETVRSYIKAVLERAGLRVFEAIDGLAGLAAWHNLAGAFELVITDIRMPRMRGDELTTRIKSESPAVPVIVISGEPGEGKFHDPAHRVYYLEKPFGAAEIVGAVQRVLTPR
jgi:CheY-like chemotaxis protein